MSESLRPPERRRPTDDELISAELNEALTDGREISDAAARMIASQLHGGQASALYSFASTGYIDIERLPGELMACYREVDLEANPELEGMISALGTYVIDRPHRGAVEGWSKLWLGGES